MNLKFLATYSVFIVYLQELLHQREQLDNIETKTGKINQDLRTSQKNITNIKSIFGGIKNWWRGDKDKESENRQSEPSTSKLQNVIEENSASRPHPGQRFRTDDGRGFYEEDDLDDEFMKGSCNPQGKTQYFKPVTNSKREELLNENLGKFGLPKITKSISSHNISQTQMVM